MLSDPAPEDALYDSAALRRFVGIDLGSAPAPDETTILNFHHLLEAHDLCGQMLDAVNLYLASRGIRITTGTIVDATIIHAPSSTKSENRERDPEVHQTRKGNQWYFGMKAHIGVDSKEGIVHSLCSTAASVSDVHMLPELLHGGEKKVWGDAEYQGQSEAIHEAAPDAQEMTSRRVKSKAGVYEAENHKNRIKASVRAKVEWPFCVLKRRMLHLWVYRNERRCLYRPVHSSEESQRFCLPFFSSPLRNRRSHKGKSKELSSLHKISRGQENQAERRKCALILPA